MSWFLGSRSKKKKPRRQWVKQAKRTSTWDPARWYPVMRGLFIAGAVILAGVGYVVGREALMRQVGHEPTPAVQVRFIEPPTFMRPEQLQRIEQQLAGTISVDPLDRKTLVKAEQMLAANPWIEHVQRIERHREGHVLVAAEFRVPVALIGVAGHFYLIDAMAHRLPGMWDYEQLKDMGLAAITGVAADPPAAGQIWPGADVAAGLKLAALMSRQSFADQVRQINVANYNDRRSQRDPQMLIFTSGGGVVAWGMAPGEEGFREPDAQKKLAMLRRVAASARGRIDGGGKVVDVYTEQPLTHSAAEQVRYTSTSE